MSSESVRGLAEAAAEAAGLAAATTAEAAGRVQ